MPDVSSITPADVRLVVALDVHKLSIVAATLPPAGGRPEVCQIETTDKATVRPEGLDAEAWTRRVGTPYRHQGLLRNREMWGLGRLIAP